MHHVQDLILTMGSLVFVAALIPSLLSGHKPALLTSMANSIVLCVFAGVYSSLQLWFAAVSAAVTGILWLLLAVQRILQEKSQ